MALEDTRNKIQDANNIQESKSKTQTGYWILEVVIFLFLVTCTLYLYTIFLFSFLKNLFIVRHYIFSRIFFSVSIRCPRKSTLQNSLKLTWLVIYITRKKAPVFKKSGFGKSPCRKGK